MGIIYIRKEHKRGAVCCKDCEYLVYGRATKDKNRCPYKCELKDIGRHYTSEVVCKEFKRK